MYFNSSIGKIYYEKVGHGPHLSFLHGFCEDHRIWEAPIAELQKKFSCLLIDFPGFGKSTLSKAFSIADLAQAVLELLYAEKIKSTCVFGHSMGAYVALEMLSKKPSVIDAIGLIHSTAMADSDEKIESRKKVLEFLQRNDARDFLKQFYPQLVAADNLELHKDQLWDLVKATEKESILVATRAMMNRKDHRGTLKAAQQPLLFLTGDQDQHFSTESIYAQAALCENAQISAIEAVGHLSMIEDPQSCIAALNEFLNFVQLLRSNVE